MASQHSDNIPCYIRNHFVGLYGFDEYEEKEVTLETAEGFSFPVKVTNFGDETTVSGKFWRQFVKIYNLELGDDIYFNVDEDGKSLGVIVHGNKLPVTHPCKYKSYKSFCYLKWESGKLLIFLVLFFRVYQYLDEEKRDVADWREMGGVITFIRHLYVYLDQYGASYGICAPLLHTLTRTNVVKEEFKTPKRCAPDNLDTTGDIVLVKHPKNCKVGSYRVSADGLVWVNGWEVLIEENPDLKIGDRVLLVFYWGGDGAWLFLDTIRRVPL